MLFSNQSWAAANGDSNKWGFKGCLAALAGNRPFSASLLLFSTFFALFRRVQRAPGKSGKRRKRAFSSNILRFA